MKYVLAVLLLAGVCAAQSQTTSSNSNIPPFRATGVFVGVGWVGTTGDPGLSGVKVSGGIGTGKNFEIVGEFDASATNIKLPQPLTVKIRQQDYMGGGRYYFRRAFANPRFVPFAHFLVGMSHQSSDTTPVGGSVSDNAYSWQLGGGVDYIINKSWAIRPRADILRTHFNDDTQSHLRYGFSVIYRFGR